MQNACKAGLKQDKALHSSHTIAFHSDEHERLKHEVTNVNITNKSGYYVHKLQAITNLESEALSSKLMRVRSQTLGKNVSFLVSGGYKLHRHILMLGQAVEP